jgi:hypothetical protein
MSLINRAKKFIEAGGDELALLRECIADGGVSALAAVQMMAEDMYGGRTFNFELKAPAAYSLVTFGEAGLRALAESAFRTPTSKNVSLCLSILAAVAAGSAPRVLLLTPDEALEESVRTASRAAGLSSVARAVLREYVLGIEDELAAVSAVGSQLSLAPWSPEDAGAVGELFAAIAARRLATGSSTIRTYEALLAEHPNDEPKFHTFLERHPQLLDPAAAEVWSKPDLAGVREPDFVIRRVDDTYLVVEIETPGKSLITAASQLAASATQAVAQVTEYRSFLVERFQLAQAHFPRFSEPECLVVIGVESQLSADQRSALARENRSRAGVRIVGFDWLARRALTIASNVIEPQLTAQSIRVF